jgi:hypothetical protein
VIKKAIILFWATMTIEKHWNITCVARSEETSFENEASTGSNDRNSICFRRPDWILKLHLNDRIEICQVASFCEWFLHVYRRYLLMFIDLITWIRSIYINSVEFSNIFDILKTYDVIPCVCPLIDHGSRPMKSHEFLRLLYNAR